MIGALKAYAKSDVAPRKRELALGAGFWLALLLGALFGVFGPHVGLSTASLGSVLTIVVAYAAVAFGFCLAGLTIAMTLPDADFAFHLATAEPSERQLRRRGARNPKPNAYRDLLFVFSWTAVAHWAVIVFGLGLLVACGFDAPLVAKHASDGARARIAILGFLVVYAVMQFLETLIALSQVANRYIDHVQKRPPTNVTGN